MIKGQNDSTYEKLKVRFDLLTCPTEIIESKDNSLQNVVNILMSNGLNSAMKEYRKLKQNE